MPNSQNFFADVRSTAKPAKILSHKNFPLCSIPPGVIGYVCMFSIENMYLYSEMSLYVKTLL